MSNIYDKETCPHNFFIEQCVCLPLGQFLPVPDAFLPTEENDNWEPLEEIQMDIRSCARMINWYNLPTTETLVLLHLTNDTWVVYHLPL